MADRTGDAKDATASPAAPASLLERGQAAAAQVWSAGEAAVARMLGPTTPLTPDQSAAVDAVKGGSARKALPAVAHAPAECVAALQNESLLPAFMALVKASQPHDGAAKIWLSTIYHAVPFDVRRQLMQAQFNISLTAKRGSQFSQVELDTLYDQARALPDAHVESLPTFRKLNRTKGAVAEGSFSSSEVDIDVEDKPSRYSEVFRHEIGHAVEADLGAQVDQLKAQAGWKGYGGVDEFVTAAGGLGAVPAQYHDVVKSAMKRFLGSGGTFDSPTATFREMLVAELAGFSVLPQAANAIHAHESAASAASHEQAADLILRAPCPAVMACVASQGHCSYWRFEQYPEHASKHFFINHYYGEFFSMGDALRNDLASWNDSAAAFSASEWFAEIYAAWYAGPTHRQFPAPVANFFENVVSKMPQPQAGSTNKPQVPRSG